MRGKGISYSEAARGGASIKTLMKHNAFGFITCTFFLLSRRTAKIKRRSKNKNIGVKYLNKHTSSLFNAKCAADSVQFCLQVGERLEAELEQVKKAEQKQEGQRANAAIREDIREERTHHRQLAVVLALLAGAPSRRPQDTNTLCICRSSFLIVSRTFAAGPCRPSRLLTAVLLVRCRGRDGRGGGLVRGQVRVEGGWW